jgi:hypothetical protein
MKYLPLFLLLCGCKLTSFTHHWPDGSKTKVFDGRILHKQEASFEFTQASNGTVTVKATVNSTVDSKSVEAAAHGAAKGAVEGMIQ